METKKLLTLCIIHEHPNVLLGLKKRGFGAGRWNGFGGKIEEGETIEDAARREMNEEAGIFIEDMEKAGILEFEFQGNTEIMEVHVFRIHKYNGEPMESEEMKPEWFHVDNIPFDKMWADDPHWFPLFLDKKKFSGRVLFDSSDNLIEHNISEIK